VSGGLSQIERRSFERRFLASPNRRRKVEFARALARITAECAEAERPAPRKAWMNLIPGWSPPLRFAAGFAAVICIAATSWLTFQNAGMRSQIALLESQRHDLETQEQGLRRQLGEEQARAVQRQPSTGIAPVVASLVLLSNLSRAETRVEQLALAHSAQIVHIEIQLEARDDYPRFRAELHTRHGEQILTLDNLLRQQTTAGSSVSFDVPASALATNEYELSLKGVADHIVDIGFYYFGVRKQ
jgi:hypothetical protein